MPKVTEEHLERRRRQILDAARACFIRKGFHLTSMQDVFAESGLSAGAVYRYFTGKNEIIQAIASENQGLIVDLMQEFLARETLPPLDEIIGAFGDRVVALLIEDGAVAVAPEAWAEAVHNPDIRPVVGGLLAATRGWWIKLAERMRADGMLPPDADPQAVGATLVSIVPGFILQRIILGDVDADTLRQGIRALVGSTRAR